jgi:chromosome segregation protein
LEERERDLTERKIRLASHEEKWEADRRTLARLEASLGDHTREIAARKADAEACEREAQALAVQIAAEEEALKSLYAECETIEQSLAGMRDAQQQKEVLLRARESEIREIKKTLDEQLREGTELEVAAREIALQTENLLRNIQEKYGVDLLTLLPEFQPLTEEAVAELSVKLEKDRQAVENFGEVNLLALSEHEELKTRFEFLTGQIADLNASLETLQKTISRINTVSRQRFAETFAGVNQCFQDVFTRLFPGGRAELKLIDENDLLETGVDIEIRIPGNGRRALRCFRAGKSPCRRSH